MLGAKRALVQPRQGMDDMWLCHTSDLQQRSAPEAGETNVQVIAERALRGRWLAGLGWGLLLAFSPALAQLAVPALISHVVDTTGTLGAEQVQQLENKLKAFEQTRGRRARSGRRDGETRCAAA